jgi:hypothetical protein
LCAGRSLRADRARPPGLATLPAAEREDGRGELGVAPERNEAARLRLAGGLDPVHGARVLGERGDRATGGLPGWGQGEEREDENDGDEEG